MSRLADILNAGGVKYFVTGSVASMFYGEARLTRDIDIVVFLRYVDVGTLVEGMKEPEFYLDRKSIVEAMKVEGQFNAIHNDTGMKVDFMCCDLTPFNEMRFSRAQFVEILPGVKAWTSSAEDVILSKLRFYKMGGSDKHMRDISGMIRLSGEQMDRAYLEEWAGKLGVTEEWGVVKAKVGW